MTNRVWIEIENAFHNKADKGLNNPSKHQLNEERAVLASAMLNRLRKTPDPAAGFEWDRNGFQYRLYDNGGGFLTLSDNGHWFNLDFFGRP